MGGYTFDSFRTGDVIDLGRTVVERDEMLAFAHRFDPQPFHVDPVAARSSVLGGLCASGWFTCALWMRAWVDTVLADSTSQGSPGGTELAWPAPVFPGDTLAFGVEIGTTRRSAKRPNLGLVECRGRAVVAGSADRGGTEVLRFSFTGLFTADG